VPQHAFLFLQSYIRIRAPATALVTVILRFRLEFASALALQGYAVSLSFSILFNSFPTSAVLDGLFITRVHAFE
jgi:hypothetical protein